MKATELRIGNLLYPIHLNGDAEVIEIMVSGIGIQKMGDSTQKSLVLTENIHRLEPIPLTEEWLVKFGFELATIKHDDKSESIVYKCYPCIIENNRLYESDGLFKFCRIVPSKINEYHFFTFINHVHQLQNLYFALTGEELKFN